MSKTAVILFNLGGPDDLSSIRPFLFNFFMDPNIIRLPLPLRWMLAHVIANRRAVKKSRTIYTLLGGKSPLLDNTRAQAAALKEKLGEGYEVFVCMRYWHPRSDAVAQAVKEYGPDEIVLLPLYPQYSTTTTQSSFQDWDRAAKKAKLDVTTRKVCCYFLDDGFVKSSANRIKSVYASMLAKTVNPKRPLPRLLFSAHGIPESVVRDGDPYQWQCEQTARAIARETGIPDIDWILCYQSRVGPKKWIGPSTEAALAQAALDKVPVLIYPHAFVSEHAETLVEIDIDYRNLAQSLGIPHFEKVPTVGTDPVFIKGLVDKIKDGRTPERKCPSACRRCTV